MFNNFKEFKDFCVKKKKEILVIGFSLSSAFCTSVCFAETPAPTLPVIDYGGLFNPIATSANTGVVAGATAGIVVFGASFGVIKGVSILSRIGKK